MSSVQIQIDQQLFEIDLQPFDDAPKIRDKVFLLHNIQLTGYSLWYSDGGTLTSLPEAVPMSSLGVTNKAILLAQKKKDPTSDGGNTVGAPHGSPMRHRSSVPNLSSASKAGAQFFSGLGDPSQQQRSTPPGPSMLSPPPTNAVDPFGKLEETLTLISPRGSVSGSSTGGASFLAPAADPRHPPAINRATTSPHGPAAGTPVQGQSHPSYNLTAKRHSVPDTSLQPTSSGSSMHSSGHASPQRPHIDTSARGLAVPSPNANSVGKSPAAPLGTQSPLPPLHHALSMNSVPTAATAQPNSGRNLGTTAQGGQPVPSSHSPLSIPSMQRSVSSPHHTHSGSSISSPNPFAFAEAQISASPRSSVSSSGSGGSKSFFPSSPAAPGSSANLLSPPMPSRTHQQEQLQQSPAASSSNASPLPAAPGSARGSISRNPFAAFDDTTQAPSHSPMQQQSSPPASHHSLALPTASPGSQARKLSVHTTTPSGDMTTLFATPVNAPASAAVSSPQPTSVSRQHSLSRQNSMSSAPAASNAASSPTVNPFVFIEATIPGAATPVSSTLPAAPSADQPNTGSLVAQRRPSQQLNTSGGSSVAPLTSPSVTASTSVSTPASETPRRPSQSLGSSIFGSAGSTGQHQQMGPSPELDLRSHIAPHLALLLDAVTQESYDLERDKEEQIVLKSYALEALKNRLITMKLERQKQEEVHSSTISKWDEELRVAQEKIAEEDRQTKSLALELESLRFQHEKRLMAAEQQASGFHLARIEMRQELDTWIAGIRGNLGQLSLAREEHSTKAEIERGKGLEKLADSIEQHALGEELITILLTRRNAKQCGGGSRSATAAGGSSPLQSSSSFSGGSGSSTTTTVEEHSPPPNAGASTTGEFELQPSTRHSQHRRMSSPHLGSGVWKKELEAMKTQGLFHKAQERQEAKEAATAAAATVQATHTPLPEGL